MCVYVLVCIQVSGTKLASHRSQTARSNSSDKQLQEETVAREKSPDRPTAAQDRIRAKLIAISEQSIAHVKRSHDTKTSSRVRSPSPKRSTHVCPHQHVELLLFIHKPGVFVILVTLTDGTFVLSCAVCSSPEFTRCVIM